MKAKRPVYLDCHSTTPVDPRVAEKVLNAMVSDFGNANSTEHLFGGCAADMIEVARSQVAELLKARPRDVYFTASASESIYIAIAHAVNRKVDNPLKVIVSPVEHRAVLDCIASFERKGQLEVTWLPVDEKARISLEFLNNIEGSDVDLICLMAANNEVGTIYPFEAVADLANEKKIDTLIDATQAVGRIPIDTSSFGFTYLTMTAHKIYGPKGIGTLISSHNMKESILHSTPNVPGIVGLGEACKWRLLEMEEDEARIKKLRDQLEEYLTINLEGVVINGDTDNRLSNNLHISIQDVPNDVVVARLSRFVALSTGSACKSGSQSSSHVLKAMGLNETLQDGALRIGIGKFTTDEEIKYAAQKIVEVVDDIRSIF